jgi:hypothetical protein
VLTGMILVSAWSVLVMQLLTVIPQAAVLAL